MELKRIRGNRERWRIDVAGKWQPYHAYRLSLHLNLQIFFESYDLELEDETVTAIDASSALKG